MEYKIDIFNNSEFIFLCKNYKHLSLEDDIEFFSDVDLNLNYTNEYYSNSVKFITVYNKDEIIGICKVACPNGNEVKFYYLSINEKYKNKGFSKILIENLIKIYKQYFKNKLLKISSYSTEGWKFLRNNLIKILSENDIKYEDSILKYGYRNEEFFKLKKESIKIINKKD
jgi:hypothetical protein